MDSPHILTRAQKKQLGDVESSNNVIEESSKLQDNVLTPSKRLQPSRLSKTSLTQSNKTTEDNGTQNDESTLSQNNSVENNDELSQNTGTPKRVIPLWKLCDSPRARKLTTILENGKENISLTQDVSVREDRRSMTRSRRRSTSTSPSRSVVPQSRIMTRRSMRSLSESRTFPDSPIVEESTKTPVVKLRRSISNLQIEKTIQEEPTADIPIADANKMSPKMCNKVTTVHKTPPKENAKKSSSPLSRSKELEKVADTAKENLHLKGLTIVDNTKVDVKESPEEQKTPPNKNVKNTVPSENKEPNMVSPVRKKQSSNELNNANMSKNEEKKLDSVIDKSNKSSSKEINSESNARETSQKSPKIEAGQKEKTSDDDSKNKLDTKAVTKIAGKPKSPEIESKTPINSNSDKSTKIEAGQKEKISVDDHKNKVDSKAITKITVEQKSPEVESKKPINSNSDESTKIEAGQKEKTSVDHPKNKLDSKAVTKITGEQKSPKIESKNPVNSNSTKSPKIEAGQKEKISVDDPKNKVASKAVTKTIGEKKSPEIDSKHPINSNSTNSPKIEAGQKEKTSVDDPKNKVDSIAVGLTKITEEQNSPEIESKNPINSNSAKSPKIEAGQKEKTSADDPKNKVDSKAVTKITEEQKSPEIESNKTVDVNSAKSSKIEAGQKEKNTVNDPKNKVDSKAVTKVAGEQKSPEIENNKTVDSNSAKSPKIEAGQKEKITVNDPKNKVDSKAVTKIKEEQKSPINSNSAKSTKIEACQTEKISVDDPKNKVVSKAVTKITGEQKSPEIESKNPINSNSAKSPKIEACQTEKMSVDDPNKVDSKAVTKITEQNSPEIESNKTVDSNSAKSPKIEAGQKEQISVYESKNKLDSKTVTKITGEQKSPKIQSKKLLHSNSEKKVQIEADGKEPTKNNDERKEVVQSIVEEESEKENDACSTEANFESTSNENNEINESLNSSLKLNKCLVNISSPPTSDSKRFSKNSEETTIQLKVSNYNDEEYLGTHKIFCDLLKDKCTGSPIKGNHISRTKEVSGKEVEELSRNVVEQSVTESLKSKIKTDKAVETTNSLDKIKVSKNKSNVEDSIGEISKVEPDSVTKNINNIVNDGDKDTKSAQASDDESKMVDLQVEEENNDKVEASVEQCSVILTLQNSVVTSGTSLNPQETSIERSNDELGEFNNVNMQHGKNKMVSKKSRKSEVANYTKKTVGTPKESNKSINLPVKNIPKSINKRFCDKSDSSDDTEQDTKKIKSLPSDDNSQSDLSEETESSEKESKSINLPVKNIPKSINKKFCDESVSSDDTEQDTKKIKSLPSDDNSQSDISEKTESSEKESKSINLPVKNIPKSINKKFCDESDSSDDTEQDTKKIKSLPSDDNSQSDLSEETESSEKESIRSNQNFKKLKILFKKTLKNIDFKELLELLTIQNEHVKSLNLNQNDLRKLKEKILISTEYKSYAGTITKEKTKGSKQMLAKQKKNEVKSEKPLHSDKSGPKHPGTVESFNKNKSNNKLKTLSSVHPDKSVDKKQEPKELNSTQGGKLTKKRKRSKSNKKAPIDSAIKETSLTNIISNTADLNCKKFVIKNNESGKELNSTQVEKLTKKRKRSKSNKKAQIDSTIKEAPLTNIISNTADLNCKKFVIKNNESGKELNSTQGEKLMKKRKRKRSKSNKKAQIDSTIKEAPLTNISNTADLNCKKFKKNNETGIHQGESKVNKTQHGKVISKPAASNNKESANQKEVTSQQVTKQKPISEDKTQIKIKQEFVKENSALKSKPIFQFKFNENTEEKKINKGFENKQTVEHKPVFMKQNESDTKKQGTGGESKKQHANDNGNQKKQKKETNKKAVQPTVLKTTGNLFKVEVCASSSEETKKSNTKDAKEPLGFKVLDFKETPVEKTILQANGNSEEIRKSKEYEAGLKLMKKNLNTNVDNNMFKFSQQPKKYQESIKGPNEDGQSQKKIGVKRLPTELLEALTDKPIDKKKKEVPVETIAPVETSKKKKKLKLKSAILEESYIPLSTDSATQFALARLDKEIPLTSAQQAANFRNNQLYGVHNRRISAKDLHNMKQKSKANNKE